MNLCTNAGHAMKMQDQGILEMRITDFVIKKYGRQREFPELGPGRYIRISVKDNGSGMDQETLNRIFEPFFTTKRKGEGTGMGLSVVHGIIKGLNGTIKVDTEIDKGSVFHVILPVIEDLQDTKEDTSEEKTSLAKGSESILIVDDDPEITSMMADILESLGYKTATANIGNAAYKIFKMNPKHFDLVITDQMMPAMKGTDLTKELLAIRPDIPIILCTGYSESISPEQAKSIGVREYITKPVKIEDLAATIRKILDTEK
jgi:CheY-like chemotaxis protein